jgi:hypothetical protein
MHNTKVVQFPYSRHELNPYPFSVKSRPRFLEYQVFASFAKLTGKRARVVDILANTNFGLRRSDMIDLEARGWRKPMVSPSHLRLQPKATKYEYLNGCRPGDPGPAAFRREVLESHSTGRGGVDTHGRVPATGRSQSLTDTSCIACSAPCVGCVPRLEHASVKRRTPVSNNAGEFTSQKRRSGTTDGCKRATLWRQPPSAVPERVLRHCVLATIRRQHHCQKLNRFLINCPAGVVTGASGGTPVRYSMSSCANEQ